jgi:hypothetical protein
MTSSSCTLKFRHFFCASIRTLFTDLQTFCYFSSVVRDIFTSNETWRFGLGFYNNDFVLFITVH